MKKKLCNQKKESLFIHTKLRMLQRYNIQYNENIRDIIVSQIQSQIAKFIKRISYRRTMWEVDYNGSKIILVYDKAREEIVTVLPPDKLYYSMNIRLENEYEMDR